MDDHQAPDAADFPDSGERANSRQTDQRRGNAPGNRLPARAALLLRLFDRHGSARLFCTVSRFDRDRPKGSRGTHVEEGRAGNRAQDTASQVLEGDAAACGVGGRSKEPVRVKGTGTGEGCRLQVAEEELYAVIEQLRGAEARIHSVSEVKATLEEFFLNLVEADRAQASAVEVSGT